MRAFRLHVVNGLRFALGLILAMAAMALPCAAIDKPTGAPLELSNIETEQSVPLACLDPDGKTAHLVNIKLHWNPLAEVGPTDEATSFSLDIPADSPGSSVFIAQLWSASLASALAWQQPWQGARWKVLQTPATDGTGIDAALAVGMIATAARRSYPEKTVVIGSLNPDGSLGPVSHLVERLDAAAAAGMERVIIPGVQRFDTDASGQVFNIVRHASDVHLECLPVDNLVEATETVMNDPLPDVASDTSTPKYSNEVASYIDDFAHREQNATAENLKFAPKEADLSKYPPHTAAIWKSVYTDYEQGQQAYRAGQVYVAYRLFSRANASMVGVNALVGQNRATFDVKASLAESDDLRNHLQALMNPPAIDRDELQSAVLVAEMADWAYDINASLEGAQLVTKQTFSQRTDATLTEKDRARESLIFAIEQAKYLLNQDNFFDGILAHLGANNPIPVDDNAAHLLPQLLPAQLATAQIFSEGIRQRANDLRDGLLFDPRLVAYVNVLRTEKATWDAAVRKKEMDDQAVASAPATPPASGSDSGSASGSTNSGTASAKPAAPTTEVAFDPGNTYLPPHTALAPTLPAKKLSDTALCLIWANTDCEIAALDEKYLRLSGVVDPATHEWHVKDRAKLDALLQSAEAGARQGISFAEKAEVDTSVLGMIYEKAAHLRIQDDDVAALEALRNYWRCALIGNLCWQLAHNHKAQPVDLTKDTPADAKPDANTDGKPNANADAKPDDKTKTPAVAKAPDKNAPEKPSPQTSNTKTASSHPPVVAPVAAHEPAAVTNTMATAIAPAAQDVPPVAEANPSNASEPVAPRALPVILDDAATNAPPAPVPPPQAQPVPAPPAATAAASDTNDANIPVAPIAKVEDYAGGDSTNSTNAAPVATPVIGPIPPSKKDDNADSHSF